MIIITLLLSPFLLALCLTVLFFNAVCLLTGFTKRNPPTENPALSRIVSIVILNWNGKDLLAECLPSVLDAIRMDGAPHEVLVVDNGSTDGSLEYLEQFFPQVRVLPLEKNLGFAQGNNTGVRAASNDIVVLLNNDMVVDHGFLRPLINGFGPKTFAVSSQIFHQDPSARREETGKTTAVFRRGMVDYSHCSLRSGPLPRSYYPIFWAGGGSSAFHRARFLALGGFSQAYDPAYVEDADLSYQAWVAGWEVLFAPDSIVYHKHRASTGRRFSKSALEVLIKRNQFIFIWKNIRSWKFLLSHCFLLPWNCYRLTRDHGLRMWESLFRAAAAVPSIEIDRLGSSLRAKRSDAQSFEIFSKPGLYFSRKRSSQKRPRVEQTPARPRILWITAYLPHLGRHAGAGRMFQLLKRLSPSYRITLLSFLETEEETEFLSEVEPFCEETVALLRIPPSRWPLFAYEPFDEFLTSQMQEALEQCFEDYDWDLIQLEYTQMAVYADKARRIPTLLTKHEVDFAACARRARTEKNPASKLQWFYRYLQVLDREVKLTRRVDGAICMTGPDARELEKFCPSVPRHIISTGVDLDYFMPSKLAATEPRMVFVGAFQHSPNVDAMIYFCREILSLVRKEIPESQLSIVGSNPPASVLDLAAIPGVEVTGFVPDIRPYMAKSCVYVVPLRLGVGIRGKILEAWSMGMAVVATSIAAQGLLYEDDRNILIGDTAQEFAVRVTSLLGDFHRRGRLGKEGRRTAEQYYSWDSSARHLDEVYRLYLTGGV